MNEQGLQTETPADTNSESHLSQPHFDDIAIAIAQPVEPLPDVKSAGWRKLGVLGRHVSTTALLLILAGAVGFTTVALGLAGIHQRLNVDEPQAAIAPTEQTDQTETSDTANNMSEKPQRPAVRKARPRLNSSKPAARLVGEIR